MLAAFLYVAPIADLLDQAPPTPTGFAVALLAVPAVLAADAAQKAVSRARSGRRPRVSPPLGASGSGGGSFGPGGRLLLR